MHLDVPTLMLVGAFVASVSGALLLYAWYQYRETAAALWWAGADAILSAAIVLIAIGSATAKQHFFFAGLTLLIVSAAFTWAGARSFAGRRVDPVALAAGAGLWLMVSLLPLDAPVSATLHAAFVSGYYLLAAFSIYRGREDALRGRLPLCILLSVQCATQLLAIAASLDRSLLPGQPPPVLSWFGIVHFETLVFTIGTALFLVAMMKERNERRLSDQSSTDSLTGLLNRRGFISKAERALADRTDGPVAVIVFDLDRFKTINDRFGHPVGDRTLQVFAETCRSVMRSGDLTGRIGGEEFAAILPGFGVEAAFTMAERVRKAFALAAAAIDGHVLNATVCAGVAATGIDRHEIHDLLRSADAALYQAKDRGRNRVETAREDAPPHRVTNIIRVA